MVVHWGVSPTSASSRSSGVLLCSGWVTGKNLPPPLAIAATPEKVVGIGSLLDEVSIYSDSITL